MRTRYIALGVLILCSLLLSLIVIHPHRAVAPERTVSSFEECADAGYPVMESHPRQCRVPNGVFLILFAKMHLPTGVPSISEV